VTVVLVADGSEVFILQFLCLLQCRLVEHDILKMDEPILMQIDTNDPWGNDMK